MQKSHIKVLLVQGTKALLVKLNKLFFIHF